MTPEMLMIFAAAIVAAFVAGAAVIHLLTAGRTSGAFQAMEMVNRSVQDVAGRTTGAIQTIEIVNRSVQDVERNVRDLVVGLKAPPVAGGWGEMTLRQVVECAGLCEHFDFEEQVSVGDQRPDMVVHFPNGRRLAIDAKASFTALQGLSSADSDKARLQVLDRHVRSVLQQVTDLEKRAYWSQVENSLPIVVMFIPSDSMLNLAVEADPEVIQKALARHVILTTPATLVGLLLAIGYGWQQQRRADNIQQVGDMGRELYRRYGRVVGYLLEVRKGLERATESYNKAVGSFETQVLPQLRRFHDFGVADERSRIDGLEPIILPLRDLTHLMVEDSKDDAPLVESGPLEGYIT